MPLSRREILASAAATGGLMVLAGRAAARPSDAGRWNTTPTYDGPPLEPGLPGTHYRPVVTPNGAALPFTILDGIKVFHLIAEEVPDHEFAPGLKAHCWGYNGRVHGPTIEAVEGDRVRIFVTNRLPAPTTVHWHGLLVPSGMDGVGGLSQRAIHTGETFKYEFTLRQHGTFMYHSHHDEMTQMALGMIGMFVIHPRKPQEPRPDRDFVLMSSEWKITPGTYRPDPNEMKDFNILTLNARCFPGTAPLVVKTGDRVRIRLGNLSAMDHHSIHLHGYYFRVVETDGGPIPESAQWPETTALVPVGATRTVEFVADNPGDWAMHCHMTHHVMNQMGHELPNMIGVDTDGLDARVRPLLPGYMSMGQAGMGDMGDMGMAVPENSIPMVGGVGPHDTITMGGMFTILKVREQLENYDADPGWYESKPGELSLPATEEDLRANGIDINARTPAAAPTTQPTTQPTGLTYTCPMHPEVVSDQPSRCPKCKMKLVVKKPAPANEAR